MEPNAERAPSTTDRVLRADRLLALAGLSGFAVSQPLLSVAGQNPTIFTFAGVGRAELVLFALVVALGPPLVLWAAVTAATGVHRRAGEVAHAAVTGGLVAATVSQLARSTGTESVVATALVAVATAAAFVVAARRWRWVDQWVRYTSPLPVLAVIAFLALSPAGQLLRPSPTVETVEGSDLPPVVFVMLDELPLLSVLGPDGGIDEVRFPNLAGLADDSTWFRDYTVMAPGTVQSVPNILSGRVPTDDPPLWGFHPDTIFSLLAPTHDLHVSESLTQLCGYEACRDADGSGGGLGEVLDTMADVWQQRVGLTTLDEPDLGQFQEVLLAVAADRPDRAPDEVLARPDRLDEFLAPLAPGDRPGLHYLHLMLPHQPWSSYPNGNPYLDPELEIDPTDRAVTGAPGGWPMALLQQQHLFQAEYADRLVGEVVDRLVETGLYDDALVVVTADHGLTFQDWPDQRTPEGAAVADVAHVPLVVKAPGQVAAEVDESALMAVDLLPTLADLLGVDVPWPVDGHPAGTAGVEDRDGPVMYDFGPNFAGSLRGVDPLDVPRPEVDDRIIGPREPDSDPISGLTDLLGVTDLLDRELDDLDAPIDGTASVADLADLTAPPRDTPPRGLVEGRVGSVDGDRTVLVAIDGTIVTAAPVEGDGRFRALLPPAVLRPEGDTVRLGLIDEDGSVSELQVD